ncbi:MAG: hypothetical protein JO161_03140 [Planctomycetaceae bacterium]|nr:hypothetical protein [Planctomycetaceae bacterium]
MWVLFVKLLSPADWWLDPKPRHRTARAIDAGAQQCAQEPAALSSGSMITARDAG